MLRALFVCTHRSHRSALFQGPPADRTAMVTPTRVNARMGKSSGTIADRLLPLSRMPRTIRIACVVGNTAPAHCKKGSSSGPSFKHDALTSGDVFNEASYHCRRRRWTVWDHHCPGWPCHPGWSCGSEQFYHRDWRQGCVAKALVLDNSISMRLHEHKTGKSIGRNRRLEAANH
jgi:hypothetical protein